MSTWESEMTKEEWQSLAHKRKDIIDKLLKRIWEIQEIEEAHRKLNGTLRSELAVLKEIDTNGV